MTKNNITVVALVITVLAGGGGFFAGMQYQKSQRSSQFAQFRDGQRPNGQNGQALNGQRGGFRPVTGQVISTDDKSITVKLADGSSKIVLYSDSTQISKADTAQKTDITEGANVAVFGTENSDGSVTAQNIQLNPEFKNMPAGTPSASQ